MLIFLACTLLSSCTQAQNSGSRLNYIALILSKYKDSLLLASESLSSNNYTSIERSFVKQIKRNFRVAKKRNTIIRIAPSHTTSCPPNLCPCNFSDGSDIYCFVQDGQLQNTSGRQPISSGYQAINLNIYLTDRTGDRHELQVERNSDGIEYYVLDSSEYGDFEGYQLRIELLDGSRRVFRFYIQKNTTSNIKKRHGDLLILNKPIKISRDIIRQ